MYLVVRKVNKRTGKTHVEVLKNSTPAVSASALASLMYCAFTGASSCSQLSQTNGSAFYDSSGSQVTSLVLQGQLFIDNDNAVELVFSDTTDSSYTITSGVAYLFASYKDSAGNAVSGYFGPVATWSGSITKDSDEVLVITWVFYFSVSTGGANPFLIFSSSAYSFIPTFANQTSGVNYSLSISQSSSSLVLTVSLSSSQSCSTASVTANVDIEVNGATLIQYTATLTCPGCPSGATSQTCTYTGTVVVNFSVS